jgi:hypothetical protein
MPSNLNSNPLVASLNHAGLNQIADGLRQIAVGDFINQSKVALRLLNLVTAPVNPYQLATLQTVTLPDNAKAHSILRAYARTGTGTVGELTLSAYGVTPTATHVAVAPNGDLVFLATDAYTSVDVVYEAEIQDVIELTLPVVAGTGVCALPANLTTQGVVSLMEAESLVGTVTGKGHVLVPGTAGTTAAASLNLAKTNVQFLIADAVTSCRLKLGLCSAVNRQAVLGASSAMF